jgi:hypothetical protein
MFWITIEFFILSDSLFILNSWLAKGRYHTKCCWPNRRWNDTKPDDTKEHSIVATNLTLWSGFDSQWQASEVSVFRWHSILRSDSQTEIARINSHYYCSFLHIISDSFWCSALTVNTNDPKQLMSSFYHFIATLCIDLWIRDCQGQTVVWNKATDKGAHCD